MKSTVYRLSKIEYGVSKKLTIAEEINLISTILSLIWSINKKTVYVLLLATCSLALASDPSPLQDFCVADLNSKGLQRMGNTSNPVGSDVTAVTVNQLAGLNTFGISMARIDFAPWGLNAPHTHPRATEILTVIEGTLLVGFVTSNTENRLITKVLQKGDVFVFPQGLIHFQQNVGKGYALAIAGLSSHNPGVITIANAVFGSNLISLEIFLQRPFKQTST
ncbi:putative germin-like protein 2-1 [Tanacetum coccineum]